MHSSLFSVIRNPIFFPLSLFILCTFQNLDASNIIHGEVIQVQKGIMERALDKIQDTINKRKKMLFNVKRNFTN